MALTTGAYLMSAIPVWLPIPGYPGYEVNGVGEVRSLDRGLLRDRDHNGYRRVRLMTQEGKKAIGVHRLVAAAFHGPCPEGMEARHLNGVRDDNRAENVQWSTHQDNMRDLVRHGTHLNARKTHCPQGHAYTPENTYSGESRPGSRQCKICTIARVRASRAARKQVAA